MFLFCCIIYADVLSGVSGYLFPYSVRVNLTSGEEKKRKPYLSNSAPTRWAPGTVMITLKKNQGKIFSQFLSSGCENEPLWKRKRGGQRKSLLAVKLDVHMTNFKGCQNKKKKRKKREEGVE